MKLPTATQTGQGTLDTDFSFTIEGELLFLGMVCARDREDPACGCGCGRAFIGLNSHKGTTTAMVRDVPITEADLRAAVKSYFQRAWSGEGDELDAAVEDMVEEVVEIGRQWPEGTLLARRLEVVTPRW